MVSPATKKSRSNHRTSTSVIARHGKLLFTLLISTGISVFFLLNADAGADTTLFHDSPTNHPSSIKDHSFLHCRDFLNDALVSLSTNRNSSSFGPDGDIEVRKVFARFLTHSNPPFWISQDFDNLATVKKGRNSQVIYGEQTTVMERVLENSSKGDVIFSKPDDWGWFSLLAASKPGQRVRIYNPQNKTTTIRLCESILLNHWNSDDSISSRIQIIRNSMQHFPLLESMIRSPVTLLKLQGDNVLTILQSQDGSSLLKKGLTEYLWIEYRTRKDDDTRSDLQRILTIVAQSGRYMYYWPEALSQDWSIKRGKQCRTGCNFWWKRKTQVLAVDKESSPVKTTR